MALIVYPFLMGCGATNTRTATEQLLVSDAVDHSISRIDFRVLEGNTVYLNADYIRNIKGIGFVNADYIISSLRQQVAAAGCLLQEKKEDAEFIVEARVGALGTDGHEVTLGIPQNDALSKAASLVPSAPPLPLIPEISFAKRNSQTGAAKVAVFAYHRETREAVWQSGTSIARSDSKDTWLLGAGPFQRGSIYEGTHFAGSKIRVPLLSSRPRVAKNSPTPYFEEKHFHSPTPQEQKNNVELANFEEEGTADRSEEPAASDPDE